MKNKIVLTIIIFFGSLVAYAQHSDKRSVCGLYYDLGGSQISGVDNISLDFSMQKTRGVGLQFIRYFTDSFAMETGIEYTLFDVNQSLKNTPVDTVSTHLALVHMPVLARSRFADYFFISGGLLIDFDMNATSAISSQSGVGLMANFGLDYQFQSGLSLIASPYLKVHSLLSFSQSANRQHLYEYGLRLGMAYRF